jgi:hypothetical protein
LGDNEFHRHDFADDYPVIGLLLYKKPEKALSLAFCFNRARAFIFDDVARRLPGDFNYGHSLRG